MTPQSSDDTVQQNCHSLQPKEPFSSDLMWVYTYILALDML